MEIQMVPAWEKYTVIIANISLVPRPFSPPVFDCLQYVKTEGEGLGDLVTCWVM